MSSVRMCLAITTIALIMVSEVLRYMYIVDAYLSISRRGERSAYSLHHKSLSNRMGGVCELAKAGATNMLLLVPSQTAYLHIERESLHEPYFNIICSNCSSKFTQVQTASAS